MSQVKEIASFTKYTRHICGTDWPVYDQLNQVGKGWYEIRRDLSRQSGTQEGETIRVRGWRNACKLFGWPVKDTRKIKQLKTTVQLHEGKEVHVFYGENYGEKLVEEDGEVRVVQMGEAESPQCAKWAYIAYSPEEGWTMIAERLEVVDAGGNVLDSITAPMPPETLSPTKGLRYGQTVQLSETLGVLEVLEVADEED